MSITVISVLATFRNSTTAIPMGPAPITSTLSPGLEADRFTQLQPIASVSTKASCSIVNFSEGCSLCAGKMIRSHMPPFLCTPMTSSDSQQFVAPFLQA